MARRCRGQRTKRIEGPIDFVLGSDVVYAVQGFSDLVHTLVDLCQANRDPFATEIYLCLEQRWTDIDGLFWDCALKKFTAEMISDLALPIEYRVPSIKIFKLKLKNSHS
mmetsp:Transcript_15999/g.26365  ORF Transcript_15999/g.26365 Transcript_15999/m.26365 type:complete len:109 (-) Transcript_15999:450-776(-)